MFMNFTPSNKKYIPCPVVYETGKCTGYYDSTKYDCCASCSYRRNYRKNLEDSHKSKTSWRNSFKKI